MVFCFDGVIYVNFEKKIVFVNIFKIFDKVYNFICKDDKDVWFLIGIISRVNNELIVGFKLWKKKWGKVCVVNDLGKDVESFEYDNNNEFFYRDLRYIIENKLNGDICVIDIIWNILIVVESLGKYKYLYFKSYIDCEFNLLNICVDSEGCFFLLDVG